MPYSTAWRRRIKRGLTIDQNRWSIPMQSFHASNSIQGGRWSCLVGEPLVLQPGMGVNRNVSHVKSAQSAQEEKSSSMSWTQLNWLTQTVAPTRLMTSVNHVHRMRDSVRQYTGWSKVTTWNKISYPYQEWQQCSTTDDSERDRLRRRDSSLSISWCQERC